MKAVIDFLAELQVNNNREWFEAHKKDYKYALSQFNTFAEQLIAGIASFDKTVADLTLKDCTYRIYRDVRFSNDKRPYKHHMGAYICMGGKKSGYAGYYFHLEPEGDGLLGGNMISSGIYMPEPKVLKSVRDEIYDNGAQLETAIKKAKGFQMDMSSSLTRTPKGYPQGSDYDKFLRLKDIYLAKFLTNEYILDKNLIENLAKEFKTTLDFINILNRAVSFAHEEM